MSTWIMHLRVAEKLRHLLKDIDEAAYYAGAIAPDSGRMVDDFTYLPSKDVSHWKRDDVSYEQRFLDNGEFYNKYVKTQDDRFIKSLCWGYYVHILTDTIYVRDIIHPYMQKHGYGFWQDNITAIRKGWYEIDFRFLAENKEFAPFALIKTLPPFTTDYLPYFAPNDVYERIRYAIDLFDNAKTDADCVFLTHTPKQAEALVSAMEKEITQIIKNHIE